MEKEYEIIGNERIVCVKLIYYKSCVKDIWWRTSNCILKAKLCVCKQNMLMTPVLCWIRPTLCLNRTNKRSSYCIVKGCIKENMPTICIHYHYVFWSAGGSADLGSCTINILYEWPFVSRSVILCYLISGNSTLLALFLKSNLVVNLIRFFWNHSILLINDCNFMDMVRKFIYCSLQKPRRKSGYVCQSVWEI